MTVSKVLVSTTILSVMIGMAHLSPATAAAAAPAPAQIKLLFGDQGANLQTVHCRRFLHTHRRCAVWAGGYCRRWVRYTHRCG